jgi:hypothetical protein
MPSSRLVPMILLISNLDPMLDARRRLSRVRVFDVF